MRSIRNVTFLAPVEFGALGPKRSLSDIHGAAADLAPCQGVPGVAVNCGWRGEFWVPLVACAIEWGLEEANVPADPKEDYVGRAFAATQAWDPSRATEPLAPIVGADADGRPVTDHRERGRKRR